jgi:hypothetical protein
MFEKMEKQAMEARWEEEKLVRQTKTQPKLRHQHSTHSRHSVFRHGYVSDYRS